MEKEKKLKIEINWLILISVMFFCAAVFFALMYFSNRVNNAKYRFLEQYIPIPAAHALIEYSEHFELPWLKVFACLMAESEGNRKAYSSASCRGYMQIAPNTWAYYKKRLKELSKEDDDHYNTDSNIYVGCAVLRNLLDNYSDGNWRVAIEQYNIGTGSYRKGDTNEKHVYKFTNFLTHYKYLWKKFKKY